MKPRTAWLMLAPFSLLLLAVAGYPLLRSVYWAFHTATGSAGGAGDPPRFVALGNFARLLSDHAFLFAMVNTLGFTLAFIALLVPMGLGLALLMNRRGLPGRPLLRLLFFSPFLVGPVYVAVILTALLARDTGLLRMGFDPLSVPALAMPLVLLASLWTASGYAMVYVLAALQSVDAELIDAARSDGATPAQLFRHVTLPHIGPTLAFVALTAAVGGLSLFELPFVLFGGAGPGNAALTLSMLLFSTAFEQTDLGYATAMGWAIALMLTGLTATLIRLTTAEEHWRGERGTEANRGGMA